MSDQTCDRRRFVRLLAGGITLGGAAVLHACAPALSNPPPTAVPKPAPTTAASRTVQLPNRFPLQGIKPDLPPSADGLIDAAFVNYPANPPKSVQDTPGRGGEVTVATWTTSAPPTAMESNALWQAVNKELGVDLKISIQPQADYATVKLPTLIAGGELPDILYIATNSVIPQLPTFLKSKCADLSPYLSGDAVKDYPNLANFPTISWKQVIYHNAIYGVENNVGMGLTNGWLTGIFGAPNIWALDDKTGKLTATVETEPFRAAVSYARDLWNGGMFHPNAMQYNLVSARNDFAARRFAFRFDGFQSASVTFWDNAVNLVPPGKPRIMSPFPAVDGGKPTYWANSGYYSPTKDTRYPSLQQRLSENLNDIVLGRQPLSYVDHVVSEWQDNGGNQMRTEFEREIAAARA